MPSAGSTTGSNVFLELAKRTISKPSMTTTKSKSVVSADPAGDIMTGGFHHQAISQLARAGGGVDAGTDSGNVADGEDEGSIDPMPKLTESAHGWSPGVQYANEMGLEFSLNSTPFFQALQHRVDSELTYPDDFSRQHLTGHVRIEVEVAGDGRLIKFRSSTADDRILQTYCFAMLMNALDRPLSKIHWLTSESAIVVFEFEFRTKIPGQPSAHFVSTVQKNRILLGRENEIDPWLSEKIKEIFTHYVPPIFPLPGGFYVDFYLAHQYVTNLIEGTPPESEQRRARIEALHEQLRTALRRSPSGGGT